MAVIETLPLSRVQDGSPWASVGVLCNENICMLVLKRITAIRSSLLSLLHFSSVSLFYACGFCFQVLVLMCVMTISLVQLDFEMTSKDCKY